MKRGESVLMRIFLILARRSFSEGGKKGGTAEEFRPLDPDFIGIWRTDFFIRKSIIRKVIPCSSEANSKSKARDYVLAATKKNKVSKTAGWLADKVAVTKKGSRPASTRNVHEVKRT